MRNNDQISKMSISGFQKMPLKMQYILTYNANQFSAHFKNVIINIAL